MQRRVYLRDVPPPAVQRIAALKALDTLLRANRDAARAMAARFRDAARRGLWVSRRNSDAALIADMLAAA